MASPTMSDVHVSKPLTNLAIHYMVPELVAHRVFPPVPAENEVDLFYTFKTLEELIAYSTLRAPGDPANEMDFAPGTDTFACEEHALKIPLPVRIVANADEATDIERNAIRKITKALLIAYERRVQALAQNTASCDNNFAAGTAWNTASGGGSIEEDIMTAKSNVRQACGADPNSLLVSQTIADDILRWLKINAFTDYEKWIQTSTLPPVLWNMETIVGKAMYNTQPKGVDAVLAEIWSNNPVVFYKSATPSKYMLTYGLTFRNSDFKAKNWYSNDLNSTLHEVSHIVDEKVAGSGAACIITDAHT